MKRLFILALALILIIGMLPVPTYAAATDPMPKFTMYDPNTSAVSHGVPAGETYYVIFEDVTDDTGAVIGNKPVLASAVPEDNYIKYYYNGADNVFEITFKNINYQRTSTAEYFMQIVRNGSSYTGAFDVVLTLEGENVVSGNYVTFMFENTGDLTVTGTGSLDVATNYVSRSFLQKKNAGDFTLLNTTLRVTDSNTQSGGRGGIVVDGNVIIDGSTLEMHGYLCYMVRTGSVYSSMGTDTTKGIIIKNGSDVDLIGRSSYCLSTRGFINIDNSDVYLNKYGHNDTPVFNIAPTITGSYSSRTGGRYALDRSYPGSFDLHPGDSVTTSHKLNQFELVHKHYPTDCTTDSLCVCTKATVPASADEHVFEHVEAQAATCTESGWNAYDHCLNCAYTTKVEIPATGKHTLTQIEAQAATCGEIGWEAYEYCSSCDYTTIVEIPATGNHTIVQAEAKDPTCGEPGWEAHEYCTGCTSYTTKVEIPATGEHTILQAEGKEATCSEPGWEAYEYCSACNYSTMVEIPATGKIEVRPFYILNSQAPWEDTPYILEKPFFYTPTMTEGQTEFTVSAYGSTSIPTIAARLKEDFDKRPAGTRYINLNTMTKVLHGMVEHNVYYDVAVDAIKEWVEAFLKEYHRIGGKLDGVQVDVEYIYGGAWYITRAKNGTNSESRYNDPDIFWTIVNDDRYAAEIRPMLEALDFPFLAESSQTTVKSEIYPITEKDSLAYKIWNVVNSYRMCAAVDEAVYEPLLKYYPNGRVTDYQVRYINGWQKTLNDTASPITGNRVGIGSTSNFNVYNARPGNSVSGYGDSATYSTPPSYNDAVYELTPFNHVLWETNIFKNMYDATPSKRIAVHVAFFNYYRTKIGGYANTPYYAESIFHIGLMDPEPFMAYIREEEVFAAGADSDDPNVSDYGYSLTVLNDIAKELSRVAGASDRKPIEVPAYWNSKFLISGMYAGGRNIWRITPETSTGVSLEDFKVKDQAPTFYINGQTVIFPQGRIIEDGSVRQVGTCGYWVETPADVKPIIINDTDRYSKYPSFEENFEGYTAGSEFNSTTALPKASWEVSGTTANVQSYNGGNALAMTGTATISNVKLPKNITAGDSYAKQQIWEVTVTMPTSGTLNLLNCSDSDSGIYTSGGKAYYYANGSTKTAISGVSLTAGETYTFRREFNFTNSSSLKSSYAVYDANGNLLGSANNIAMGSLTLPATQIRFTCTSVSGTAYIDDIKMYPTGVTTELEAYDVETGYELNDPTATRTEDTAYRLSWMNASSEYKVAKVCNNGTVIEEIPMAPGEDGVATGVVTGTSITLSLTTESGTAPTIGDYDSGDFTWTAVAEDLGLASGNSKGNFEANIGTSIIVHDLVSVAGKETSCTEGGWDAYEYCTKCDYTTYVEEDALGHDKVTHEAKAPTCTEVGWDAYETCTRCDYTTYVEKAALGHDTIYHAGKTATYTEIGWDAYETCARCDYTTYKEIATVEPKIQLTWPGAMLQKGLDEVDVDYYIAWVDGTPTLVNEEPTGGYIKFCYVSDGDSKPVLNVTFKDVSHVTTGTNNAQFLKIYENNGHSNAFDVVITLVGNNLLDGYKSGILVSNKGNLTITGNGSLTIDSTEASTKAFMKSGTGAVHIKNTTIHISLKDGSSGWVCGLHVSNDLVIDGSEVNILSGKGSSPVYSVGGKVTIKNSDFVGEQTSGSKPVIYSLYPVVFENSNVTLKKTTGNAGHCLNMAPEIVGTYSGQWYSAKNTGEASTLKDYAALNYTAGDKWSGGTYASTSYNYFKLEHLCEAQSDDGDCTTPVECIYCGRELVAAKEHTLDEYSEDITADFYEVIVYCTVCDKVISRTTLCKHTMLAVINEKQPTCTEAGYSGDTACGACDEIVEAGEVISATGHTPGAEADCENAQTCTVCGEQLAPAEGHSYETSVTDPTCTEDGKTVYTCACGDSYEETIAALGHDKVAHEAKTPTCTEIGWEAYETCSRCDYTTYKEAPSTGHGYEASVTAPTCIEDGYTTYTCACGDSYVADEVPATGHSYETSVTNSTCTEDGKTVYTCACGDSYEVVISALGHDVETHEAKAATCTEIGWDAYETCSRCDYTTYQEIPATGHSFNQENVDAKYLKSAATLNAKAVYYYSCACGESSQGHENEATFEYGQLLSGAAAQVDGVYYATLAEALQRAQETNSTVVLTKSFSSGSALVINGDVTIDFNGNYYTASAATDSSVLIIGKGATVKLMNGKLQIRYAAREQFNYMVLNNGTLSIENFTLNGVNLYAEGETSTIMNDGTLTLDEGTVVNIKDKGLITTTANVTKAASVALDAPAGCHWADDTALEFHAFDQEVAAKQYRKSAATTAAYAVYYKSCTCGESNEGYAEEATFTYGELVPTKAVARVGENNYYNSLEEAVAAAIASGKDVELLKANNSANAFVISGDVTIDFCGLTYTASKTVDSAEVSPVIIIENGANVTLKNGKIQVRYGNRLAFNYLVENNGTLYTENITLNGTNLYAESGNATIMNNGTLSLGEGTVVNVSFTGFGMKTTNLDVVKVRSVVVLGVEGYHWVSGATLTAHAFDKEAVVIQHRKSAPNMNSPAIYYTSCACGENSKGTAYEATFEYGEKASTAAAEAEIDGYYYRYFDDALAAALENGGTVKMLKDLNTAKPLTLNSDVTIDFNGFTYTVNQPVTGTQGYAVAVIIGEDANVNFLNGRLQIRYNRRHMFNYLIENNGTLTTENIVLRGQNVYKAGSSDYTAAILNTGVVDLKAGTVVEIRVNAINTTNANVTKDATIEMKAAKGYHWSVDQTTLIPHTFDQEIVMSSLRKSAATINSPALFYKTCTCGESSKEFTGETFEYGDRLGGAAAKVGSTYYASLEEAITAGIASGETVEVQMAIKNAKALIISGDVTIDFGGYAYNVNTPINAEEISAVITVAEGANVTLKNGTIQVLYAARNYFDALIENNGSLYVENIALKGANVGASNAVLVKGNALTKGEGVTKVDPAN